MTVTTVSQADEDQRVDAWNIERMLELGLSVSRACDLTNGGADWHEVAELLEHGATSTQVYRILAPL